MRTRNKVAAGFAFLMLAVCTVWFIVSGAITLAKKNTVSPNHAAKGDVCEFKATYATECVSLSNYEDFILLGKEYYYFMLDEQGLVPFLVRAKPSWIKKNFDADGYAIGGEVTITGAVTRMDHEITNEIRKIKNQGYDLKTTQYIDTRYREFGRLRILSGVAMIVVGTLFAFGIMSGILRNGILKVPALLLLMGTAFLMLYTIGVGGV